MNHHIHPAVFKISVEQRKKRLNQAPKLIWFTGLSGSGKSTLANAVESHLFEDGYHTYLLDGDNIRTGLNKERQLISDLVGEENFLEIFVDCPLTVCESRDVKGLYAKARKGLIKNFTGIDSPYEIPLNPKVHIFSDQESVPEAVQKVIKALIAKLSH